MYTRRVAGLAAGFVTSSTSILVVALPLLALAVSAPSYTMSLTSALFSSQNIL